MDIAISVIVGFLLVLVVNYSVFRRSLLATVVEFILRFFPSKRDYKKAATQELKQKDSVGKIPKLSCKVEKLEFENMPVYILSSKKKSKQTETTIELFLHGGAYIKPASKFHWKFAQKHAKKIGVKVVMPLYPLAPNNKWEETHNLITKMYKEILNNFNGKVILIGDSAGGGLAASLNMTFAKQGLKQPHKTILISPWVDITMSNPRLLKFEKKDPLLEHSGAREIGKTWAGELNTKDYRVSAKYGDFNGLENVFIFVGTREILFPDIYIFYLRCKNQKNISLCVHRGMNHDYPLFPIWEAKVALKQMKKIIVD